MYWIYLAFVVALFSSSGYGQECDTFKAVIPDIQPICTPQYLVTKNVSTNATAGEMLLTYFYGKGANDIPSKECAIAYSTYFCAASYPQCSNGTALPVCQSTCQNVLSACAKDTVTFPLPSCTALSNSNCSLEPKINLDDYYTDCSNVSLNATLYPASTGRSEFVICRPDYLVPNLTKHNYDQANSVIDYLQKFVNQVQGNGHEFTDNYYQCFKAYAKFYCTEAFPVCPTDNKKPVQGVCYSYCFIMSTTCKSDFDAAQIPLPDCRPYPTNTACIVPEYFNSTYVGGFFDNHDPPIPVVTTGKASTTRKTSGTSGKNIDDPPPGGWAAGGGIGAGVLIGLLLIIGVVMLIMKKQDSR